MQQRLSAHIVYDLALCHPRFKPFRLTVPRLVQPVLFTKLSIKIFVNKSFISYDDGWNELGQGRWIFSTESVIPVSLLVSNHEGQPRRVKGE